MTTKIESSRDLVGIESISFIRPQTIRIDIIDARPNTRLYPFFDGVRIDEFIRPSTALPVSGTALPWETPNAPELPTLPANTPIITNSVGRAVAYFDLPGGKFNTGDREIIFADTPNLSDLDISGNVYGYAKAKFFAKGMENGSIPKRC